ncbi:MAG: ATP-binding cassette domain-containing protein, partial [Actinomycetota bacterium]|nr:ATP-binding cassette domain-containing protein [Actinomycetota bacterium]
MIDVEGLSVHFGGVVSLDEMTIQFPEGTCGLIGPNGAGKTTFLNVLSGFVTPRSGRIEAMGQDLLALPDYKRARWGLRRTFQTEQAIEKLTVFDNVATVYEHSGTADKAGRTAAVDDALEFVGLSDVAQ